MGQRNSRIESRCHASGAADHDRRGSVLVPGVSSGVMFETSLGRHFIRIPRYTAVAIVCAALHNAIMIGTDWVGMHYFVSQFISLVVLLPTGYLLASQYVFFSERDWSGFLRYSFALSTNFPVALAIIWLLRDLLDLPMIVAAPLSTILLYVWNYTTSSWAMLRRRERCHD